MQDLIDRRPILPWFGERPALSISPTHDIVEAAGARGEELFFAADGRLYHDADEQLLNVWNVLVYYWPEVLGGVVAIFVIVALVAWRRVRKRPREAGHLYCRRCNYNLHGLVEGSVCPECGTNSVKRKPVKGKSTWRRLAAPLVLALLVAGGYAVIHIARVPRDNAAMWYFTWPSPALAAFGHERKIAWLEKFDTKERLLVELDPATGARVRVVCPLVRWGDPPISVNPDGRIAVMRTGTGNLAAVDLHSGRRVRSAPPPSGVAPLVAGAAGGLPRDGWITGAGWIDEEIVCVTYFDSAAQTHTAYQWNVASGALTQLFDIPISGQGFSGTALRTLRVIPQSPPIVFELPDRYAEVVGYGQDSKIRVRSFSDGAVIREIAGAFWPGSAAVVLADGESFYTRLWQSPDLAQIAVADGRVIESFQSRGFSGTLQKGQMGLAYHSPTQRLFAAEGNPESVFVRDAKTGKWIAELASRIDGLPHDVVAVSPDGRWVATRVIEVDDSAPGRARFISHILIFDLTPINKPK